MRQSTPAEWFAGLKTLNHDDFPKRCACCGRVYQTEEEYFRETNSININHTGLKASIDDDDSPLVELYRNCVCGSTLMAFFSDRRDQSETGTKRRLLFDELINFLMQTGIERQLATSELKKVIHGERSELLESWYAKLPLTPPINNP